MTGVIINVLAVVFGSLIGMFCHRGIPKRISDAVLIALGLCTVYIGIDGLSSGENVLVTIISAVVGAVIGTLLDLDGKVKLLGDFTEKRFKNKGSSNISQGFVTASLLYCVGAMTIVGSLNAGLRGDFELLYTKSILDGIASVMLAASLGFGVLLSAVSVLVVQGGIVIFSGIIEPLLTESAINEMICVGSVFIIAIGLNIAGIARIKVADYTPSIILAPVITLLFEKFPI